MNIVEELLAGSERALSRLITLVENGDPAAVRHLVELYPRTGRAYVVGITGSPGTGKSTLTDKMTRVLREQGYTVGIIAVDPSSPFTGGAILGDRIRMDSVALDPGVFIRSMATRGHLGGLAGATRDAVKILDAFGKDIILVETIGVGQDEVEVMKAADTILLVLVPGLGDAIQSMKSGVMEIGHVYVVNKCDRDGAEQLVREVSARLEQDRRLKESAWEPPVVKTVASMGKGAKDVVDALLRHRDFMEESGSLKDARAARAEEETLFIVEKEIFSMVEGRLARERGSAEILKKVAGRDLDPYTAARKILDDALKDENS